MLVWVGLVFAEDAVHVFKTTSMLKTAASLQTQVLVFVAGHLEEFPRRFLALLPISIRKWLLLHLPIADVCMSEQCSSGLSDGINMEDIWKARGHAGIPQVDSRNKGYWKQRCLEQLWDMAMTEPSGCWLYSHLQSPQGLSKNCVHCKWHYTERGLFALDTDLTKLYSTNSKLPAEYTLNRISRIVSYQCQVCHISYCVPSRFVKCIVKEYNLMSLMSIFYTYCHFKPSSVTICHQNMYKMAPPLSQQILRQHPSVLNKLVAETKFLKLLPLYFRPKCSTQSQADNYNTIVNCLHTSLQPSLEELDVQLLISPFEPSKVSKPFRSLKFLSIKSLQNNILDRSYANDLISLHKPTLKVVKISQCTFKSSNLTSLTELFTSPQFSVMLFNHSVFLIDTFQTLLFSFVNNTTAASQQQNRVLSFKASLLEGNNSFEPLRPTAPVVNVCPPRSHPCHYLCSNLNIEDIRVAFQSINQLKSSLKQFPPVHLNRLNLKEMNAIEISSSLPYIEARELCLTISTALTNWNLIILNEFFKNNVFHCVSLCLDGNFLAESNTELIEEFSGCIIRPMIPLQSIKFTWMHSGSELIPQDEPPLAAEGESGKSNIARILTRIMKYCKLDSLELDLSEYYSMSSQSTLGELYKLWSENEGNKTKLAKLVIGRESISEMHLINLQKIAEIVIEKSTTCDL